MRRWLEKIKVKIRNRWHFSCKEANSCLAIVMLEAHEEKLVLDLFILKNLPHLFADLALEQKCISIC